MYVVPEQTENLFEFEHNGTAYRVPMMKALSLKELREHNRKFRALPPDERQMFESEYLAALFDANAPGALDDMSADQFNGLMAAYLEANGSEPGE